MVFATLCSFLVFLLYLLYRHRAEIWAPIVHLVSQKVITDEAVGHSIELNEARQVKIDEAHEGDESATPKLKPRQTHATDPTNRHSINTVPAAITDVDDSSSSLSIRRVDRRGDFIASIQI